MKIKFDDDGLEKTGEELTIERALKQFPNKKFVWFISPSGDPEKNYQQTINSVKFLIRYDDDGAAYKISISSEFGSAALSNLFNVYYSKKLKTGLTGFKVLLFKIKNNPAFVFKSTQIQSDSNLNADQFNIK